MTGQQAASIVALVYVAVAVGYALLLGWMVRHGDMPEEFRMLARIRPEAAALATAIGIAVWPAAVLYTLLTRTNRKDRT